MKINITAGKHLNNMLQNKNKKEIFIPFNEAMIIGTYVSKLFSEEFIGERAATHKVSIIEYKENMMDFLSFLKSIKLYYEVVLWFGDEPFCQENVKVILQTLKEYQFEGVIILNLVIEETAEVISSQTIYNFTRV